MTRYLELADYLHIAEAVPGVPAELIADFNRIGLADSALAALQAGFGGVEAYPDFETKAAVLCWHLVKNHPLPEDRSSRGGKDAQRQDAPSCHLDPKRDPVSEVRSVTRRHEEVAGARRRSAVRPHLRRRPRGVRPPRGQRHASLVMIT